MSAVLRVEGLSAGYGGLDVVHDVAITVAEGEIVALLGANGAGKTTTLRAISGLIRSRGQIELLGSDVRSQPSFARARAGMAHIPQGRGTFAFLTVRENLWAGAHGLSAARRKAAMSYWYERFPLLAKRREQLAGSLSGGEQQLLAVARALISRPRLVLCDEPSLGLAPLMVQEVFAQLKSINAELGTTMLIVEQNAQASLRISDRVYVLESGRVTKEGLAAEVSADDEVRRAYLGI